MQINEKYSDSNVSQSYSFHYKSNFFFFAFVFDRNYFTDNWIWLKYLYERTHTFIILNHIDNHIHNNDLRIIYCIMYTDKLYEQQRIDDLQYALYII